MKFILYGAALPFFVVGALVAFTKGHILMGAFLTLATLGMLAESGGLRFLVILLGLSWLFGQE